MTTWRTFPTLPAYEVSDEGEVRLIGSDKPLKTKQDRYGYRRVNLIRPPVHNVWFRVHLLVLETFVGPKPSTRHRGIHQDDNRRNNHINNLSWKMAEVSLRRRRVINLNLPHPQCECGKPHDFEIILRRGAMIAKLTPRETEVLILLFKGLSTADIAAHLGNTEKTIKGRISGILNKFGVCSRGELVNLLYPL